MKTATLSHAQKALYMKLVYTHQLLLRQGGPEEAGELFEVELDLLSQILATYHIPDTPEYEQFLFDFADGKNKMEEVHQALMSITEKHLLSSPQTTLDMLETLKQGADLYFALTLNEFRTNLYTIYLCNAFLEEKASDKEVANDLDIIKQRPELMEYLFFISGSELPEAYYLFELISGSGLCLYRKFLEMPEADEMLTLKGSQLLRMSTLDGRFVLMNLLHPGYDNGRELQVVCSIGKFMELMLVDSPIEYLIERMLRMEAMETDLMTATEIIIEVNPFHELIIDATLHIHREEVELFTADDPLIRYELRSIDLEEGILPCRYVKSTPSGYGEMSPDMDIA